MSSSPVGLHRVITPSGVLPQAAEKLDARAEIWPDEVRELGVSAGPAAERRTWFNTPLTSGYLKTERLLHILPRSWVMALESAAGCLPTALRQRLMVQTAALYRKPATAAQA